MLSSVRTSVPQSVTDKPGDNDLAATAKIGHIVGEPTPTMLDSSAEAVKLELEAWSSAESGDTVADTMVWLWEWVSQWLKCTVARWHLNEEIGVRERVFCAARSTGVCCYFLI